MSPAKRKVAVSARAGGKRRGAPKAGGKARPVARKRLSSAAACDMPVSKLAAAFDRIEGVGPFLSHVPVCGACTTSLTVLAASKQGLKHLTADGAGTAVERVLARGQEQGQRKLADLVYELVKACLVVVQDIDRRLHLETRPRAQEIIDREVRGVVARLPESERNATAGLPATKPSADRALAAAGSCIAILEQVEGGTERQRLSNAVWLICSGRPGDAEALLSGGLASNSFGVHTPHVYANLLWSLNRQDKQDQVIELRDAAVRACPSDWLVAFNLAVAAANSGRRSLFLSFANQVRTLHRHAHGPERQRQVAHMNFEVPRLSAGINASEADVRRALGLPNRLEVPSGHESR